MSKLYSARGNAGLVRDIRDTITVFRNLARVADATTLASLSARSWCLVWSYENRGLDELDELGSLDLRLILMQLEIDVSLLAVGSST